jgi:hypothetical protein
MSVQNFGCTNFRSADFERASREGTPAEFSANQALCREWLEV